MARRGARGHGAVVAREVLKVGPYEVVLTRKRIKRAWLRVDAPEGPVRVSAPQAMGNARIEAFVLGRASWIEQRRSELAAVDASPRTGHILEDGRVLLWGEPCELPDVLARAARVRAEATGARPRASRYNLEDSAARERAATAALKTLLMSEALRLVGEWEPRMGVRATQVTLRDMRSRWGSCSTRSGRIRFSLTLVHYPVDLLELIVVHELTHLLEPSHNAHFHALMTRYLPDWPAREQKLRRLSQGRYPALRRAFAAGDSAASSETSQPERFSALPHATCESVDARGRDPSPPRDSAVQRGGAGARSHLQETQPLPLQRCGTRTDRARQSPVSGPVPAHRPST